VAAIAVVALVPVEELDYLGPGERHDVGNRLRVFKMILDRTFCSGIAANNGCHHLFVVDN